MGLQLISNKKQRKEEGPKEFNYLFIKKYAKFSFLCNCFVL